MTTTLMYPPLVTSKLENKDCHTSSNRKTSKHHIESLSENDDGGLSGIEFDGDTSSIHESNDHVRRPEIDMGPSTALTDSDSSIGVRKRQRAHADKDDQIELCVTKHPRFSWTGLCSDDKYLSPYILLII